MKFTGLSARFYVLYGIHPLYRTLQEANDIFPGNTNMDLIFGRPCQTPDSWLRELNEVVISPAQSSVTVFGG